MRKRRWVIPAAALATFLAIAIWINSRPITAPDANVVEAPTDIPATSEPAPDRATHVTARMTVRALDGTPLPGMIPIATDTANAFNQPVATGPLTGAEGTSQLLIPRDRLLYIRAWDPNAGWFATNYFDIPPSEQGTQTPPVEITMARAANLGGILVDHNNNYLANLNVEAMLTHPSQGPWWPARGITDETGYLYIPALPPGQYDITLTTTAGTTTLPATILKPGESKDLAFIKLDKN